MKGNRVRKKVKLRSDDVNRQQGTIFLEHVFKVRLDFLGCWIFTKFIHKIEQTSLYFFSPYSILLFSVLGKCW